jgi:hypothetical protein
VRLDRNLGWVLIPGTRNAAEVDLAGFPMILALLRNPPPPRPRRAPRPSTAWP